MGEEKKPTVFYVVKVEGENRSDVARSATRADAEKHVADLHAAGAPNETLVLVIEEREEEPHEAWKPKK